MDDTLDLEVDDPLLAGRWSQPSPPDKPGAPPRQRRYPDEVYTILEQARMGDRSVLPKVREIFDRYPEIGRTLGDPLRQSERLAINRLAGGDVAKEEAIRRWMEELRAGLQPETALQRLLVGDVALNWLFARGSEQDDALLNPAQRQLVLDQRKMANRHLLAAIRTLAEVRKAERQSPSPLNLARRPVEERRPANPKDPFTLRPPRAL